jgi:hypothetical protein
MLIMSLPARRLSAAALGPGVVLHVLRTLERAAVNGSLGSCGQHLELSAPTTTGSVALRAAMLAL